MATNNTLLSQETNLLGTELTTTATPIRIEAERLTLTGYRTETTSGSGASGGSQISLNQSTSNTGSAVGTFSGPAGTYQVRVGYFDENDGVASATIRVAGQSNSFSFNRSTLDNLASPRTFTTRVTHNSIQLNPGDRIEIQGTRNQGEYARFDYIEFVPISAPSGGSTPPTSGGSTPPTTGTAAANTNIGTNLNGISDWSTQYPFTDFFKNARAWIPGTSSTWNTGETSRIDLDSQGWVRSLPTSSSGLQFNRVTTLVPTAAKFNRYIVLYDGEGELRYAGNGTRDTTASRPGRDVITTTGNNPIQLSIVSTDPNRTGNYVRNIRVIPEPYINIYQTQPFNPDFVNSVRGMETLRFMDWMDTNNSTQRNWSDRPQANDAIYSADGVPLELMVQLANQTGVDPWFNIPHQATDDYVRNFAQYVKEHLNPGLKVYVEYSNEVWNGIFSQTSYATQQGNLLFPNQGSSDFDRNRLFFAKRTTDITRMFDSVFGADKGRVMGVLAAQAANTGTATSVLNYIRSQGWTPQQAGIDTIAIAPYFGGYLGNSQYESTITSWTRDADGGLNRLFRELSSGGQLSGGPTGGALASATRWMQNFASLARQNGLTMTAYEGGQHLAGVGNVANNQAITNLFIAANRDPRMGDLYRQYLNNWNNSGGDLFTNFSDVYTPSKWGSWGARESLYQTTSPKWSALQDIIQSRLSAGSSSPTTLTTSGFSETNAIAPLAVTVDGSNTSDRRVMNDPNSLAPSGSDGSIQASNRGGDDFSLQAVTDDVTVSVSDDPISGTTQVPTPGGSRGVNGSDVATDQLLVGGQFPGCEQPASLWMAPTHPLQASVAGQPGAIATLNSDVLSLPGVGNGNTTSLDPLAAPQPLALEGLTESNFRGMASSSTLA
ncbi:MULTISPECIES: hypothetical protein [unclassified Leptolyngbya]|uniref:hypothetical protein n=1 Tax=unclassified Leptolyngbya TaxID=2650499 RepID=UPI00168268D4|nr:MULTISPECIES: hypothetical protein [unclassified Leptolyngbya]MBD1913978.1 hypothetical protein [Leptolyngbya sp. FACHB-8]MBD2155945.1 hypothetical protein [Leptolyngbya sp. FACHB-16]